jgi:hypothetical protein
MDDEQDRYCRKQIGKLLPVDVSIIDKKGTETRSATSRALHEITSAEPIYV